MNRTVTVTHGNKDNVYYARMFCTNSITMSSRAKDGAYEVDRYKYKSTRSGESLFITYAKEDPWLTFIPPYPGRSRNGRRWDGCFEHERRILKQWFT